MNSCDGDSWLQKVVVLAAVAQQQRTLGDGALSHRYDTNDSWRDAYATLDLSGDDCYL